VQNIQFLQTTVAINVVMYIGVEVLTSAIIKSAVFWCFLPFSRIEMVQVAWERTASMLRVEQQGKQIIGNKLAANTGLHSEIPVNFYQSTWHHISEDMFIYCIIVIVTM
jgi:hypothetical protein